MKVTIVRTDWEVLEVNPSHPEDDYKIFEIPDELYEEYKAAERALDAVMFKFDAIFTNKC